MQMMTTPQASGSQLALILPHRWLLEMSGDIWLSQLVGGNITGIHGVETRDAATYPTTTMTTIPQPPHQQENHPAQNFNSARLRNPAPGDGGATEWKIMVP